MGNCFRTNSEIPILEIQNKKIFLSNFEQTRYSQIENSPDLKADFAKNKSKAAIFYVNEKEKHKTQHPKVSLEHFNLIKVIRRKKKY